MTPVANNSIESSFNPIQPSSQLSGWGEKAVQVLQENSQRLDQIPPTVMQTVLDRFYENRLKPLLEHPKAAAFNEWIDSNGHGEWVKKLGTCLAKLPLRSVRDMLSLVYQLVRGIIFTAVHPLKGINQAAELFIRVLEALMRPETYTRFAAAGFGASLGQCAITGQVVPTLIGLSISSSLFAFGLAYGTVRAYAEAPVGHILKTIRQTLLEKHLKPIPSTFLTGLFTGFIVGGVQRSLAQEFLLIKGKRTCPAMFNARDYARDNFGWDRFWKTVSYNPKEHAVIIEWKASQGLCPWIVGW